MLVVPQHGGDLLLEGPLAASFLAALLPKVNGSDCSGASITDAVNRVTDAERNAKPKATRMRKKDRRRKKLPAPTPKPSRKLRPWERLAFESPDQPLLAQLPERRLALETPTTFCFRNRYATGSRRSGNPVRLQNDDIGAQLMTLLSSVCT